MRVEIWGDIGCPWCYIGKARFEEGLAAFTHRDEIEVVYRSFELAAGTTDRAGVRLAGEQIPGHP
jgi:predicted DsbA family dithiol-disulfide isomerase